VTGKKMIVILAAVAVIHDDGPGYVEHNPGSEPVFGGMP
jgi:hypothetical protein